VGQRVVGRAAAVDQDQLVTRAEAAQVQEAGVRGEAVLVERVLDRTGEFGKGVQRVVYRRESLLLDVVGGNDGDRSRALDLDALDARAGDRDPVEAGGAGGWGAFGLVRSLGGFLGEGRSEERRVGRERGAGGRPWR